MRFLLVFFACCVSVSVKALDEADVSIIDEYKIINTTKNKSDWSVNPADIDKLGIRYRSQNRDLTQWSQLDPYAWLDFKIWKEERKMKDESANWRMKLREVITNELVGRVLKCIGYCKVYRGSQKNQVEYMSKIYEGDEVVTSAESAMWMVLVDGTLIRFSSKTSLSFNEVNIRENQFDFITRVNYGFTQFAHRDMGTYQPVNLPESDLAFSPLKIPQANREYAMIQEFREFDQRERLQYAIVPNPGYLKQYKLLNQIFAENSARMKERNSYHLVYTPTITLGLLNSHLDIFYGIKEGTKFKVKRNAKEFKRMDPRERSAQYMLRGYLNSEEKAVKLDQWLSTNPDGSQLVSADQTEIFEAASYFTDRIPSILHAREIWLNQYSMELLSSDADYEQFAENFGYRLWNVEKPNESQLRLKFAKEFIRRTETTNLINMKIVFKDYPPQKFDSTYFARILRLHYSKLKGRFNKKFKTVREMTDAQYYLWIMRYGQRFLATHTR